MTNENCLAGVKCPTCGNENTFLIEVITKNAKGAALARGKGRDERRSGVPGLPRKRLCRPGDAPPLRRPCRWLPRSRRWAGLQRSAALNNPTPTKGDYDL
jgi:hypothetical protein